MSFLRLGDPQLHSLHVATPFKVLQSTTAAFVHPKRKQKKNDCNMLRKISYAACQQLHRPLHNTAKCYASVAPNKITEYLLVNECDGVREIVLNHAQTRNSLSMGMMDALDCALNGRNDDVNLRCIVLTANGKIWSAGHNLKEIASDVQAGKTTEHVFRKLGDLILGIPKIPVPVIAKVNGYAAAAGCQLAAACDIVVCTEGSKFSTPGVHQGIFCSTPGVTISRAMPRTKSAYMVMTGLPISGRTAYEAGLAAVCVPDDGIDAAIADIVAGIKKSSRAVVAYGKQFYYEQQQMPLEEAYRKAAQAMCNNIKMTDSKEGIDSFVEKRKPKWTHTN